MKPGQHPATSGPSPKRLWVRGGLMPSQATNQAAGQAGLVPTDLAIADGRVLALWPADANPSANPSTKPSPGSGYPPGFEPEAIINAQGLWVLPGLVDLCVRLREPGYEYRATLESEMQAAVAGGVTSLVCPPDTDPVLDEPGLVEMLSFKARQLKSARVFPLGALTQGLQGQRLTEMAELAEAGCVGFSQAECAVLDTRVLLQAMRYASNFNLTVMLRPTHPHLGQGGVAHAGPYATRMGLPGIPVMAETLALHTLIELQKATGARLHIARISSAQGLDLVRQAKAQGLPITCDVGIHHVHLSDLDIAYFDANAHLLPPLRSQRDREAIGAALSDGTIDAICSDHAPVDDDAKLVPFGESEPGATAVELLLALAVQWQRQAQAPVQRLVQLLCQAPGRIIGQPVGSLAVGARADLCLFNPQDDWVVGPNTLYSQGKHTPFTGLPLQGRVQATLVQGQVVFCRNAAGFWVDPLSSL